MNQSLNPQIRKRQSKMKKLSKLRSNKLFCLHKIARYCVFSSIVILSGCAFFGSSGPSVSEVENMLDDPHNAGIQIVKVDDAVANKLKARNKTILFSETFVSAVKEKYVIGAGDKIEVSIWEAPPAMLFGMDTRSSGFPISQKITFPEQMVGANGNITIPFMGELSVADLTPRQIERAIVESLKNKANNPQIMVRVSQNNTANVTVIGEVTKSARIPLTPRGETLLDVLASAGGVRQQVKEITLQLTRGNQTQSLALETIINDPKQNVILHPGDIITAKIQPLSITILGAAGKNQELGYEAKGITLAQAMSRAGGLNDDVSDARAVFIFRFEEREALNWEMPPKITQEGKVPVIYQVDMDNPSSFFVAQNFPMSDKDVLYVSNASSVQFQKFMNLLFQSIFIVTAVVP